MGKPITKQVVRKIRELVGAEPADAVQSIVYALALDEDLRRDFNLIVGVRKEELEEERGADWCRPHPPQGPLDAEEIAEESAQREAEREGGEKKDQTEGYIDVIWRMGAW